MAYQPNIPPISELLEQEEGVSLDFKSPGIIYDAEELTKHVSAIANTVGGFLIVGVDDKTKEPQRDRFEEKDINTIVSTCRYKCKPAVNVYIKNFQINSKEVLVVVIPRFTYYPHRASDDKHYVRSGKSSTLANEQDLAALFAAAGYYLQGLAEALKEEIKGNLAYADMIVNVVMNEAHKDPSDYGKQFALTYFSTDAWQAVINKGEIGLFGVSEITSLLIDCYRKIQRVNGLIQIQMVRPGSYNVFNMESRGYTPLNELIFKETENIQHKLKELRDKLGIM